MGKGRTEGSTNFTDGEKQIMLSLTADYLMFGLESWQIKQQLTTKMNRTISDEIIKRLIREVRSKRKSADEWLTNFTRDQLAEFYRLRINELEYIQKILLTAISEESEKPGGKNKYLMNQLARTIGDNSKLLAEFGMAPPILAKIKMLLPVDITDMNQRLQKHEQGVKELINNEDHIIDLDKSNGIQEHLRRKEVDDSAGFPTEDTRPKTGFYLDADHPGNSDPSREPTRKPGGDSQRVF